MAEESKVQVKLAARCLVDGKIREAGEIVELPEVIAKDFGQVQSKPAVSAPPTSKNPE